MSVDDVGYESSRTQKTPIIIIGLIHRAPFAFVDAFGESDDAFGESEGKDEGHRRDAHSRWRSVVVITAVVITDVVDARDDEVSRDDVSIIFPARGGRFERTRGARDGEHGATDRR